jgi:hypothetical protein
MRDFVRWRWGCEFANTLAVVVLRAIWHHLPVQFIDIISTLVTLFQRRSCGCGSVPYQAHKRH